MEEKPDLRLDFVFQHKGTGASRPRKTLSKPVGEPRRANTYQPPTKSWPVSSDPPSKWDTYDGPRSRANDETGDISQLKKRLIECLEEALAWAKGEKEYEAWDLRSPSWPYTKIGGLMLKCIGIADMIADKCPKYRKD